MPKKKKPKSRRQKATKSRPLPIASNLFTVTMMSKARMEEKIATRYDGDASHLIDLTRAATVLETADDLDKVLDSLDSSAIRNGDEVVYARNRMDWPSRFGFCDLKLYLRNKRGYISAMRLVFRRMLEAQQVALSQILSRGAIRAALTAEGPFAVVVVDLFNFEEPDCMYCIDGFDSFDAACSYARARQQDSVNLLREPVAGIDTDTLYTRWLCVGEATAAVMVGDVTAAHVRISDQINEMILEQGREEPTDWPGLGKAAGTRAMSLCDLITAKPLAAILERHGGWLAAQRQPIPEEIIEKATDPSVHASTTDGPIRAWSAQTPARKREFVEGSILTYPCHANTVEQALKRIPAESERDRADLRHTSFFNVWDPTVGPVIDELNMEGALLDKIELDGYSIRDVNFEHASMVRAQLSGLLIRNSSLRFADLREARIRRTQILGADFQYARLERADMDGSEFFHAYFTGAKMAGANLRGAHLVDADFTDADLSGADMTGADLRWCRMIRTKLNGAILDGARVFGLSAWSVETDAATLQRGLVISEEGTGVTVDRLDIAQLLHLVMDNRNLTHIVSALTSRLVLILGRFVAPRMEILRFVASIVERHGLIPVIFDFDAPGSRDMTETVGALAHLSALVIADLTDPKSVPQELSTIVPSLPSLPVIPIIDAASEPYSMFPHFLRYPWVQAPLSYADRSELDIGMSARLETLIGIKR